MNNLLQKFCYLNIAVCYRPIVNKQLELQKKKIANYLSTIQSDVGGPRLLHNENVLESKEVVKS